MSPPDLIIHSGGQTGVDRAALDAAMSVGVSIGGWCPRGRRAEGGPIPLHYPLRETPSNSYAERTAWNVRDADATLVLTSGAPDTGTALTIECAHSGSRPLCVLDLDAEPSVETVARWLREHQVRVLNVAGPRESSAPGVYARARRFIAELLG